MNDPPASRSDDVSQKPRITLLRSAVTGALVSSLLGPAVGTFALLLWAAISPPHLPLRLHEITGLFGAALIVSIYNIGFLGPSALILGAMGGAFIGWRMAHVSQLRLKFEASMMGLVLGAANPVIVLIAALGGKEVPTSYIAVGALAGVICALFTIHTLCRKSWSRKHAVAFC